MCEDMPLTSLWIIVFGSEPDHGLSGGPGWY
jgi:hypothetical protein